MSPVNLFELTRVSEQNQFALFERYLSNRSKKLKVKEREKESLILFTQQLIDNAASYDDLSYFYFSYQIPQISKEFDLLRIGKTEVLNIELKSKDVGEEKIRRQLSQNKHYLNYLSLKVTLFTFIADTKQVYHLLDNGSLQKDSIASIVETIQNQKNCYYDDICSLFKVSNYLISPINTPEKFLKQEYFLTSQQEKYKKEILQKLYRSDSTTYIGITGGPGTGKTLLLYDLALECTRTEYCCLIHCGILSEGHIKLNKKIKSLKIISAKDLKFENDLSKYKFIFLDESQRFYKSQFEKIISSAEKYQLKCIFSYDSNQILSKGERRSNVSEDIESLDEFKKYQLSNKIRTNRELAAFIKQLFDLKLQKTIFNYPSVFVSYANNKDEADLLIKNYKEKGFTFINYTPSNYCRGSFDSYSGDYNTHCVVGQEFDKVLMLMDHSFAYDKAGKLRGRLHPNPNYLYRRLLFQGLTRVRDKLAIIVINNQPLFEKIMSILDPNS